MWAIQVRFGHIFSENNLVKNRIAQGSVITHLLFLIMINDVAYNQVKPDIGEVTFFHPGCFPQCQLITICIYILKNMSVLKGFGNIASLKINKIISNIWGQLDNVGPHSSPLGGGNAPRR